MADETKQCTTCGRRFSDDALFCPKDGTALVPLGAAKGKDPFVGREILGHIEIKSLIGAGAMGRVYRAYQRGIDRDVAVKILHKDLAANPDLVARFLREAKVASRLQHPNVVQVLLAGQLEDGTMYLVMEYLDGISLHSAMMAAGGTLALPRALHVALQIADAIGEAHGAGVVHRDVKPENAMLIRRGDDVDFVKVLDFGIARLGQKEKQLETQAGLVFGTARYLSPEGARGEPVGPQSDVYALATLVYQMLAGRTPFEHDSSVSLLVAQIHDPPPPLHTMARAASVPKGIEAAVMKNLAKDAKDRDADGHAFGRALLEAAAEAGYSPDDLLPRPTIARNKRVPSLSPGVPIAAPPSSGNASPVVPSSPISDATPGPPGHVYHPSYSGKPRDEVVAPKPRVAATIDDPSLEAPKVAAPAIGGATVGMPPSPPPKDDVIAHAPAHDPKGATVGMVPPPLPESLGVGDSILGTSATPAEEVMPPPAGVPRRGWIPALVLVLGLVAVTALGVGGYRLGFFGKPAAPQKNDDVEALLEKARNAMEAHHWDAPPGDNVVELTDQLLTMAPSDTRIHALRNEAAERILHEALEAKARKDPLEELRLYRIAKVLEPNDEGVQQQIESLEADLANDPTYFDKVTDGGVSQYVVTSLTVAEGDKEGAVANKPAKLVATVRDGPAEGGTDPKAADASAHFLISGPGIDKTESKPATAEGTTKYVATYVFKQAGEYKVFFFARPDGFPVKSELDVKVGKSAYKPPTWPTTSQTLKLPPNPTTTGTGVILTPDPTFTFPVPTTGTTPLPPPTLTTTNLVDGKQPPK